MTHLLLFDLDATGHHPSYLKYLLMYWQRKRPTGTLQALVSPDLLIHHPDVVETAQQADVTLTAATSDELTYCWHQTSVVTRTRREWALCGQYVRQLGVTHVLVMYLDFYQVAMLFDRRFPSAFSGIYFRPDFHYGQFAGSEPRSWTERLQRLRKRLTINAVLRLSKLHTVFSLDPVCVPALNQQTARPKAVWLPDPVWIHPAEPDELTALRQSLGIEPNRRVLLVFGFLDDRKGIEPLTDALEQLSDAVAQSVCLLLAGPMPPDYDARLTPQLDRLAQTKPIQIVRRHVLIPEAAVQPYFLLSNVVMALYQRHIGMSSVLVRAAAARKPVLASEFGLVGELVRRHQLGLTVDEASSEAIAYAINQMLTGPPAGDVARMDQFAGANQAQQYAKTIFDALTSQHD